MHCIYATEKTELGTFTGSYTTEGNADLDIESPLSQPATDAFCAANPATVKFESLWQREKGGAPCPPTVQWDFQLNLLRPGSPKGNLYIASE